MKKVIAIAMIAVSMAGVLLAYNSFTTSESNSAYGACNRRPC